MAKNNNKRRDENENSDEETPKAEPIHWSEERWNLPETHLKSSALLDEIFQSFPPDDPRTRQYLMLLRHQLETDERQFEEAQQALLEFEETYNKLTQPANRIGVYLGAPTTKETGNGKRETKDETALVAVGDQEFVVNIDPNLEDKNLKVGTRIMVNEAYAIVGDLGPSQSGPIAKIGEVLDENRLRVATDPQGLQGRIVYRGESLKDVELKSGDEVRMEPNFKVALELFAGSETKDYFLEDVPEIPWEKIGGQQEAIGLIKDTIELPLLYPELFERFGKKPLKGILLYGPPGCGKPSTRATLSKASPTASSRDFPNL